MRRSLHDAWWRLVTSHPPSPSDTVLRGVLRAGSWLYGPAAGARNACFDRGWIHAAKLPCPVISVGNLSVGGTGKTACVEWLSRKLAQIGRRVAILSRGYGARARQPYWLRVREGQMLINDAQQPREDEELPDEPQLLAMHLAGTPVVIGRQREHTGRLAVEQLGANVLVLDDGLQYRRLVRDCEVVLVNAQMPLGGWPLLPRGPMREPLSSLRRADVLIMTKADQSLEMLSALQERLRAYNRHALMATAIHEPVALEDPLRGTPLALERADKARVVLLSSIGDPDGFEQTVRRLGACVLSHLTYPDHHRYQAGEWKSLQQAAVDARAEALLTTEKDWVRLRRWFKVTDPHAQPLQRSRASGASSAGHLSGEGGVPVWVLRVRMRLLTGEEDLDARLIAL